MTFNGHTKNRVKTTYQTKPTKHKHHLLTHLEVSCQKPSEHTTRRVGYHWLAHKATHAIFTSAGSNTRRHKQIQATTINSHHHTICHKASVQHTFQKKAEKVLVQNTHWCSLCGVQFYHAEACFSLSVLSTPRQKIQVLEVQQGTTPQSFMPIFCCLIPSITLYNGLQIFLNRRDNLNS